MPKYRFLISSAITVALFLAGPWVRADEEPNALQRVQARGALEVAVYKDFPPFSFRADKGRVVGIDADIARALAERLGVAAAIRTVGADESMEDDLRNNIWKGHYLGGGVADVMLHVPYDDDFAEENDRVIFVAPYYREQIVVAVDTQFNSNTTPLELFTREKVGVELDTLADFYLLSADNGAIRNQVVHFRSIGEAVAALKRGELAGVTGPRSEIEFALGEQQEKFAVGPIQMPGLRSTGWDLGVAVKQGNDELARVVAETMQALRDEGVLNKIFDRYHSTYQLPSRLSRIQIKPIAKVAYRDAAELCKKRP